MSYSPEGRKKRKKKNSRQTTDWQSFQKRPAVINRDTGSRRATVSPKGIFRACALERVTPAEKETHHFIREILSLSRSGGCGICQRESGPGDSCRCPAGVPLRWRERTAKALLCRGKTHSSRTMLIFLPLTRGT